MLPPGACLKFSYSEWEGSHASRGRVSAERTARVSPVLPSVSPIPIFGPQCCTTLPSHYVCRTCLPLWRTGCENTRPFINKLPATSSRTGGSARLTRQPLRSGGERLPAFQLTLDDEDRHLVVLFRLVGAVAEANVRLAGLHPDARYRLSSPFDGEFSTIRQRRRART